MEKEIYITKHDNYMILVPGERFKLVYKDDDKISLKHLETGVLVHVNPSKFKSVFEKEKPEWTEWDDYANILIVPLDNPRPVEYPLWIRDNGKKIQVKTIHNSKVIKSESTCASEDQFDFERGAILAISRLKAKLYKIIAEDYARSL